MGKLYLFNLVTLDGFFEDKNHDLGWHNVDEEFNDFANQQLRDTGLIMFGRDTYQMMASFWPSNAALQHAPETAKLMNTIPKAVISTTLQTADWNNTRLFHNDLPQHIRQLKQEAQKDIAIFGSAKLASSLYNLGLIDETRLLINPIVLGAGTPLFQGITRPISFSLMDVRKFKSGNVLLIYDHR